jgi:hypothetical protein
MPVLNPLEDPLTLKPRRGSLGHHVRHSYILY